MNRLISMGVGVLALAAACTGSASNPTAEPEPSVSSPRFIDPSDDGQVIALGRGTVTRTNNGSTARVVIEIQPATARPVQRIMWTLRNEGEVEIGYGHGYVLHRLVSGKWQRVKNNVVWTQELILLRPGATGKPEQIFLANKDFKMVPFPPGFYRMTTDVELGFGYNGIEVDISALFRVVRPNV